MIPAPPIPFLPTSLLERLHIEPYERQRVSVADDRDLVWEVGKGRIVYQGREWVCPIVFGPEEQYLLGATTLELFNLAVDPNRKELVPGGTHSQALLTRSLYPHFP